MYDVPADAEVGRFLGEAAVLPGVIEPDDDRLVVRCALGRLQLASVNSPDGVLTQGECQVLVRPEQLTIWRSDSGDPGEAGGDAVSSGVVEAHSFFGHDALVQVRLEAGPVVGVRVHGAERFDSGDRVLVRVNSPVSAYEID